MKNKLPVVSMKGKFMRVLRFVYACSLYSVYATFSINTGFVLE